MRKIKIKVGSFIKAKHKKYSSTGYEGIVTESFSDLIQIYGSGYREKLGHHELEIDEYNFTYVEKEKIRFVIDQEIRSLESNKLKAEVKFNELKQELEESYQLRNKYLGKL